MKVKNILFSQNSPNDFAKTPYAKLVDKYGVQIDFHKFFQIKGIDPILFKDNKIVISNYSAIIFTSKNAVNHFFEILKSLNITLSIDTKFFCINQSTAFYLKKFVVVRKRKTFYANGKADHLANILEEYNEEKFLLPCSLETCVNPLLTLLDQKKINYTKAEVFQIVMSDLRHININKYDMIVFFSPFGIQSLKVNFPNYKQKTTVIGALGYQVLEEANKIGIKIDITAPTAIHPSIFTAIDDYLQISNGVKK